MTTRYVIWAKSEQEAIRLQSQGWVCDPKQPVTHHHTYSILLRWPHESAPPAQVAA